MPSNPTAPMTAPAIRELAEKLGSEIRALGVDTWGDCPIEEIAERLIADAVKQLVEVAEELRGGLDGGIESRATWPEATAELARWRFA